MIRTIATALAVTLSAPALAADKSAMCEGWAGNWRIEQDVERDPQGAWKPTGSPPEWRVEPTAPGKCRFLFGADGFELDLTGEGYGVADVKDGKLVPVGTGRFVMADLADARSWSVVVDGPRRPGSPKVYRYTMTMAGDTFVIYSGEAPTASGPFTPHSLTVHRRRP